MLKDNYNILNMLRENKESINIKKLVDSISSDLQKEVLTDTDKELLNLVFKDNPEQIDLDNCLAKYDIEAVGGHKALMLAYFMKMHPSLKYPNYVAPRLKGLLQFYRFQNMKLISHYTKICNELKKADIDFIIFKGGCMKHLRPEYPRVMGDIDILVDKKNWKKCGKIAENLGYEVSWNVHSMDLHLKSSEAGIMDIHNYIVFESDKEKAFIPDLFKRAIKQKVFGVNALVPCNEDLMFIMLANLVRNLRNKTSYAGIPYTLFDCQFLINSKPDFDWNIVINNSIKTNTEKQIYFAIQYVNSIVPNLLPDKIKYNSFFEKDFEKYCILLIYQRFFLWEMKQKSHKMKIRDLFSSKEFFIEYIKLKPKYFILKMRVFRKTAILARMILRMAGVLV